MNSNETVSEVSAGRYGLPTRFRRDLLRVAVIQSWPVFLSTALLGGLIGGIAGTQVDEKHTASAAILINPLEGNAFYPSSRGEQLVNLTTEAQMLLSDGVAMSVIDHTGAGITTQELTDAVTVAAPVNTQILEIDYTSTDPAAALRLAQGYADVFLDSRRAQAQSSVTGQLERIEAELSRYESELAALTEESANTADGTPEANRIAVNIESVAAQIAQLNAKMSELATTPLNPGQVITPATIGPGPVIGVQEICIAAGVLGGLLLGAAFALYRSRDKASIRSTAEVRAVKVRTLATLPNTIARTTDEEENRPDPANAAYVKFRAQILGPMAERRNRQILFASASQSVSAPLSALPLARSLATAEVRTILVDSTGELLQLAVIGPQRPGLAEVLRGDAPLESAVVRLGPALQAIAAGQAEEDRQDLYATPRFAQMLSSLSERADIVIVAASSLSTPETQALAGSIPAVIVEVHFGATSHRDLSNTVQTCLSLSAKLLGAVSIFNPRQHRPAHPSIIRASGAAADESGYRRSYVRGTAADASGDPEVPAEASTQNGAKETSLVLSRSNGA